MDDLQFTLGQRPCMDAVAGRGPLLVPDPTRLDAQRRWPLFTAAAVDRGVRGVFSFPVAAGAALAAAIVSERRAEVHQATGIVAAQLSVSMTDALAALRAHAYAHDLRLSDLAAAVLARRVRLGPDSPLAPPVPAAGDLRDDENGSPEPGQQREEEE